MNICKILLTNVCNYNCYYCTFKRWLMTEDQFYNNPEYTWLQGDMLLKYIKEHMAPDKWVIELSGGEPTTHPHFDMVIQSLADMGFFVVIKTNGSRFIQQYTNQVIVAAWHKDRPFPKSYTTVLVIRNPDDDWQSKVDYCEQNSIPYITVRFNTDLLGEKTLYSIDEEPVNHCVLGVHINSAGSMTYCQRRGKVNEFTIQANSPLPIMKMYHSCPRCRAISDVERFLPDYMKQKFEDDFCIETL